jgi:hypothetical protein
MMTREWHHPASNRKYNAMVNSTYYYRFRLLLAHGHQHVTVPSIYSTFDSYASLLVNVIAVVIIIMTSLELFIARKLWCGEAITFGRARS